MCRYSESVYKSSFICLAHRHVAQFDPAGRGGKPLCPTCRAPMINMGRDFAAPRKGNDSQWRKLTLLVAAHGPRHFDSCGCDGPGPRPRTLGQAKRQLAVKGAPA